MPVMLPGWGRFADNEEWVGSIPATGTKLIACRVRPEGPGGREGPSVERLASAPTISCMRVKCYGSTSAFQAESGGSTPPTRTMR